MNRGYWVTLAVIGVLIVAGAVLLFLLPTPAQAPENGKDHKLQVVAVENFWGSLAKQIGGNHVEVNVLIDNPSADPHDYKPTSADARAIANADYVIINGVGYDAWAKKLLVVSNNPKRDALVVGEFLGKKPGDNPHLWYNPAYVKDVVMQIDADLSTLDPTNAHDYEVNALNLLHELEPYQETIKSIKEKYAGTKVGITEDVFSYLTEAAGLDVIFPPKFVEQASGGTPPAQAVAEVHNLINNNEIAVLLYNTQATTPLIQSIKTAAKDNDIPVVGMTETLTPKGTTFQAWMERQVQALQLALTEK